MVGLAAIFAAGVITGTSFTFVQTTERVVRPPSPPPAASQSAASLAVPSGGRAAAVPVPAELRVLAAIWKVETDCGRNMKRGDGGLAAGHLQQHEGHWRRGCEYLGVNWPWPQDTADLVKCRHVALANWHRDAPAALEHGDVELLARTFRLPFDPWRADNDEFWRQVRKRLTAETQTDESLTAADTAALGETP